MAKALILFEDERAYGFHPLTLTRPVFDLVCGILPLSEKIRVGLKAGLKAKANDFRKSGAGGELDVRFHMRGYLRSGCEGSVAAYEDLCETCDMLTFVNGRLLFREQLLDKIDLTWQGKYVCDGNLVWANVPAGRAGQLERLIGSPLGRDVFADLPAKEIDARLVSYPWDLIKLNGEEISRDFALLGGGWIETDVPQGAHLIGEDRIRIGQDVKINPGVVLDASSGPVSIEQGVTLMANASLKGPVHVGRDSIIRMGARIYGDTTIGPVCKVGGEVGETIIQGYSNKQHDGFVGHSYLGEWVNLGAGTDTSDMKNNYSTVRVRISGKPVDTGEVFVGLFMGDHSKSGIGSIFNTGSVVGVCCNIFGPDYPPKYIPSFTWGGKSGFDTHDLDKAIKTAKSAMERRDLILGVDGESVLRTVFDLTVDEREAFLRTGGKGR